MRRHASRLFVAIGLALATLSAAHAQLSVRPEATTLHETDTFEITVEAVGVDVGTPDFSPLDRDFAVLSTRSSSQYQSINGQVEAWTRWTLTAKPRRAGRLTLPSLQLGGHRSSPVAITVKALDSRTRAIIDSTVFFEVEAAPQPVYVQAQLVVTRRLFYADGAQLYGDIPATPELDDAVVQAIGSRPQSIVTREGRRYGVIEHQFAVFPERSGRLTIPSVAVSGSIRLPAEFGARRRTAIRVRSEALEIEVLPIPSEYPAGAPWLPATRVELLEDWSAGDTLTVGTPVQRTLLVRAEGTVASMVPPLKFELPDAIRGYPDPPTLTDAAGSNTLIGTRTEASSLVPGRPGTAELPPLEMTWFDTEDRVVRTARLESRKVDVTGTPVPPSTASTKDAARPKPIPLDSGTPQPAPPITSEAPTLAHVFAFLLIIAVTGWAATGWRLHRHRRAGTESTPVTSPLVDEAGCFKRLNGVFAKRDAQQIRRAVTEWGETCFECAPHEAIERMRGADAGVAESLARIDAMLYAEDPGAEARGPVVGSDTVTPDVDPATLASLKDGIARIRADRHASKNPASTDLPPLYPA